ncbi:GNAT family N-acetyltransferase [Arthrobacter sp. Sa2BUA2]|uniref:GNAT family N-acetyltransferase n=1 Tax=Arthrobacter pullicola TaxID=2762224 RepID=A0ABR8YDK0_9MICC|nr:GNAT family N-acetyltransferase [Arthrobacter pullicola]MBD8042207.1 GNAT family N-acetyltransferase [Arthrobacter pullicola]
MTTISEEQVPAGSLLSDRLELAEMSAADVDALIVGVRCPSWAEDFPQAVDEDAATQYFQAGLLGPRAGIFGARLIRERGGAVIGTIGFLGAPVDGAVEVTYNIVPSRRGGGYATEALIALSRFALAQPGVERVTAYTDEQNDASMSLLLTAGFMPVESSGPDLAFVLHHRTQLPDAEG